jgi:hypothetical protein
MPSDEWHKQLSPDCAVLADAMSEEQTFRSELGGFQKTFNSFKKFNGLNGLNVLNPLSCR